VTNEHADALAWVFKNDSSTRTEKSLEYRETISISNSELAGHIHILGQSGMGKSTLIEQFILQRAKAGEGVCFIDPHGTSAERILDTLPAFRTKDVLYINPACDEYAIGINLLEKPDNPNDRGVIVSEVMRMFKGLFADSWGVRIEQILRNTVLALLECEKATLLSIRRMLVNKNYREYVLGHITNHVVKEYWREEFSRYPTRNLTDITGSTLNKIAPFIADDRMRRIVGQTKSTFDFRRGMVEKWIVIVNLSKSRVGKEQARNLGALIVTKIAIEAMQRDEREALANVYPVVIDEIQNVSTEVISEVVTESRKGELALIGAHQYLDQFNRSQEVVRKALVNGTRTKILFQLGQDDAETYERVLSKGKPQTDWKAGELQSTGPFNALINSDKQREFFETEPEDLSFGQYEAIKKESNYSFGRRVKQVDEALNRFYLAH